MARHCIDKEHDYGYVEPKLLQSCEKGNFMNRLEECYTLSAVKNAHQTCTNVLNDLDAVYFNSCLRFHLND